MRRSPDVLWPPQARENESAAHVQGDRGPRAWPGGSRAWSAILPQHELGNCEVAEDGAGKSGG